jgi:polysaccharide biosynthesis transport protein
MAHNTTHRMLPPPVQYVSQAVPAPLTGSFGDSEVVEGSVPLSHYLWILRRQRWKILGFMLACTTATLIVSVRLIPFYEATATIDIDRQSPPGIIGQEAARGAANDADQFLATQVKLIQSDSVLRPVAKRYKLLARENGNGNTAAESGAAGEAESAPVALRKLKVTRPPNTYLILISYRSPDPKLAAAVANDVAHSYIAHTYDLRFQASSSLSEFMEKQIEALRAKMERSTAALATFERELNVINPEEKTSILSARLLQLNTEYTNAQADRVRKEAAFRSVSAGSLEAALASGQGESLRKLAEHLNDAQEKFVQIQGQYGVNHPEYRKAAAQMAELRSQIEKLRQNISRRVEIEHREALNREQLLHGAVADTKSEFDRLNARSFEYQQLKREAEADKSLYGELVRRIKEAGINASFQNSSIRLADAARPSTKPVFPNIPLNLGLALTLSAVFAIGAAIVSDVLDKTVRDPEEIARSMKTTVLGTLPVVKNWRRRIAPLRMPVNGNGTRLAISVHDDHSEATYNESVRTLRNTILLGDFDRQTRSILVTSASPAEGKSTIALHLSIAHAEQGRRTLLVDGDLRRPSVHRKLGFTATKGLSNVLAGELGWRDAVVKPETVRGLDVLPAGSVSRRAADLIGAELSALLDEVCQEYDLVVLDGPPLLGFAESLQMATCADGVLIVARSGETNRNAISSVLATLTRLRVNVLGLVLNEVNRDHSDGYYYYYTSKYYKYYRQSEAKL